MKQSILYYLTHPKVSFSALLCKFSDRYAIQQQWSRCMDYPLDLNNPRTFFEKVNWLKLYDRNPLYTKLCDKLLVKDWVIEKIGTKYIIPTLAVYNSIEDIKLEDLPEKFVLKCNHDSGTVFICKDKSKFPLDIIKKSLSTALKHNYFYNAREWSYKNIKPRVFAEAFIENDYETELQELVDYKFFCFNGEPKIMYIANDGAKLREDSITTTDFFDMDFNHLPMRMKDPNAETLPTRPKYFEEMKKIAAILSQDIPFVRIDLYETSKGVLFGEYTFYHSGGFTDIYPIEWRYKLGDMIKLPAKAVF